jgi:hypothetical protein
VEINYLARTVSSTTPEQLKPGETYVAIPNGKSPYLCVENRGKGRFIVALDTGVLYEPRDFPTTRFVPCIAKVLVDLDPPESRRNE